MPALRSNGRGLGFFLGVALTATAWSAIKPLDYPTWFFELIFGFAGIIIFSATWKRFPLSTFAYVVSAIFFCILAMGAKYTYTEVPLFNWIKDILGMERNWADRVGHFMQGFTPAILARELLLRTSPLKAGKWLSFITVSICLAVSAFYELIEWWTVVIFYPDVGPEWLGHQGDVWDAQWDMFLAMCGAALAVMVFARIHNRSMKALGIEQVESEINKE